MHPELRNVSAHMRELGLNSLAHAIHLTVSAYEDSEYGQYRRDLSVIQAAHAAEILGKAAIAEQHPLLIFNQLPKSGSKNNNQLDMKALFVSGKTITYQEVPERLWATTGYEFKELALYIKFGSLRNSIQHFAAINSHVDMRDQTLRFIFKVIDPLINDFWNLFAANCIETGFYTDEHRQLYYLLHRLGIEFLIPQEFENFSRKIKEEL